MNKAITTKEQTTIYKTLHRKLRDRTTQTSLKTGGELDVLRKGYHFLFPNGTRCVTLVTFNELSK